MKKNIFASIVMISLFISVSTLSYAREFTAGTSLIGSDTFAPSKGVTMIVVSTTIKYTMESAHKQGIYKYATTHKDEIKKAYCNNDKDPCGDNAISSNNLTAGDLPDWTWEE